MPNDADRDAARAAILQAALEIDDPKPREDDQDWLARAFAAHREDATAELQAENARLTIVEEPCVKCGFVPGSTD